MLNLNTSIDMLNKKEIQRIESQLSDYLNDRSSGYIEYEFDFVMYYKTFVMVFITGDYTKNESFRYGQMRENVEFECETFLITKDEKETYLPTFFLNFTENETFNDLGNGKYI